MSVVPASTKGTSLSVPPKRQRDDYEFLPAALEILETPLSPVRRGMSLTICGFAVVALALSYVGHIDVIAAAQGKIQPVGRTKTVQPVEGGRVLRIAVENGQTVHAGDLLLELDPDEAKADAATLLSERRALRAEAARRRAAIEAAAGSSVLSPAAPAWDADTPVELQDREMHVLNGDLTQLGSQVASLEARAGQSEAEATRLRATIAAQETLVATLKQRVDMRTELLARNAESRASVIDAQEAYQAQGATLAGQKGQLGESDAALLLARREIDQAYAAFVADNAQKLAEAERRIDDDTEKLGKTAMKSGHMLLRSPIDGRVQGLTVTTLGQVVASGEQVLQVVPTHPELEIECYIANGDAGFVKAGQDAVVKVQSFPFTDYGTVEARVTRVAEDAIPLAEADEREGNPILSAKTDTFGGAQRLQNLVYLATLTLSRPVIRADGGDHALTPGMAVTVEIKTGSRRILSFLFAPLVEAVETAMRER